MCGRVICVFAFVLVQGLVQVCLAAAPDPDVAWYRLNEGSGDTTADSSGNGHTGTILDGTWHEGGWDGTGWCLDFDGNNDRVEIGAVDVVGAGITLAAWVQPDDFDIDDGRIISKADEWLENDHWWMLSTITGSQLRFRLKTTDGQTTPTLIAGASHLEIGEWQHCAATWDGTTMRLWQNAVDVGNMAKGGDAVATDPGVRAAIGSQPKGAYDTDPSHGNKFFDGRIDEVRIYSYALSEAQLKGLITGMHPLAYNPDPSDGAEGVTTPLLQWGAADTAVLYKVYFGTDPNALTFVGEMTWTVYWHGDGITPGVTYYWRVDGVEEDGAILTGHVWSFTAASVAAYNPQPPDGAKWVDPSVVKLQWSSGVGAESHDVYFGTSEADVAAGTGGTFKGNRYPPTLFDPGPLDADTTYYWRIDEVAGGDKEKGEVWSFTTATPGGGLKGEYYNNANLSGIPAIIRIDPGINFQWGNDGPGAPLGTSGYSVRWSGELEVAFSETYTITTSADDAVRLWFDGELVIDKWFAQERGAPKYDIVVDLEAGQRYPIVMEYFFNSGNAVAELYWKSAHTPEQIIPAGAFSPPLSASSPRPADGAVDVTETPTLSWTAGDKASQHDVYFGTDEAAVAAATTASASVYRGRQTSTSYVPTESPLEWGVTYHWRIDEVNGVDLWAGGVWSFTTANFVIVDDFEDYNDYSPHRIFQTWIDGFGYTDPPPGKTGNGTGSTVGYLSAPFAEPNIVHSGSQSMPFGYDNTGAGGKARYSEAEREFVMAQDFSRKGVKSMSLWIYGDPTNTPATLYVGLQDSAGARVDVPEANTDLLMTSDWQEVNIDLSEFSPVNLMSVKKIYLGVGNRLSPMPGPTGSLFIDDIRLYRPRCVASKLRPEADLSGNCVVDYLDVEILSDDWLLSDAAESVWDAPFTSGDIGVPLAGSYSFDGTTYTITGNGPDIWDGADDFNYAYRQISGDCQMTVRVKSMTQVHAWAKAGVMIRDTLDAGSTNAMVALTGGDGDGGTFQWRSVADDSSGSSRTLTGISPPACVRLVREGDTFAGYIFLDGKWQQEGMSATVPMTDPVYIGLAVTSHTDGVLETATFDRECTFSAAELNADGVIDFKDYAILADMWLDERLWP